MDEVFKALADRTRRHLLDRLHAENGQTLGELCARLGMARQSVTQHLAVLEAANLVTTVRRGREKLHYLNPVPLHEVQERWIDKFERPRLRLLADVKRRAEEPVKPDFVYVTYIESTPERVWEALTDADLTATYWGHHNVSDWRVGSTWAHRRADGSGVDDVVGVVLEADPPRRLVASWVDPADEESTSTVTFLVQPYQDIVRLTVTHAGLDDTGRAQVAQGWPAVLSNLKSLLETGRVLSGIPWEMPV
ncbi:ArsR/SmtB family transcription factor [Saccharothrix sp. Mg75]|uniref:ArsR/SmtB family transcription factor n=1 Tax=Saccharothrix sp. Mg75 TaxID=3445357 RepID=UPI003EE92567